MHSNNDNNSSLCKPYLYILIRQQQQQKCTCVRDSSSQHDNTSSFSCFRKKYI